MVKNVASWADKELAIRALEKRGKIDPHEVVLAAQDPDSPLHECFTWDDAEAASQFRLEQARALIRRVKFEVLTEDATERVVRYVPSPDPKRPFNSLPEMKSENQAVATLAAEVAMLHGLASRVYGIALAKEGMVGASRVLRLREIRDRLAVLNEEFGE